MKNFITMFKLNLKVGKVIAIVSFFAFASLVAALPRQAAVSKAEGCAVFSKPIFNPFGKTFDANPGVGCNDFAVIAGGVHGGGAWSDNFSANAGDTVTLRVYVHNGAATNSDAVMHDVRYSVNLDGSTGSTHTVSAKLTASNADTSNPRNHDYDSITINTPANSHLELVSGELNHYIGDKQPCFDFSESFFITIKVVSDAPTGQKVFNATHDNFCSAGIVNGAVNWNNTSDVTSVKVTVTANGNTTQIGSTHPKDSVTTNWLVPGNSYTFTEYDQNNNQIGQTVENIDGGLCGGGTTSPANSTVTLSLNSNVFCVYSKNDGTNQPPTYTVNGSSDLANQQIAWSSTKNGVSTGEVNSNYGQVLDGSGHWTQVGSTGFTTDHIGSWTKTVVVLKNGNIAATSQPFAFTVKDCSTAVSSSYINLTLNSATFCVYSKAEQQNDSIDYFVTGSSDLAGQQVAWSSTKNGVSTGEVNANYGQVLDSSAHWAGVASRAWNVSDIGSWTKTVIGLKNGQIAATSQPFTFTVRDCSKSVNSTVSVNLNAATFCVYSRGEKTNDTVVYTVIGSSDLANQQIAWSSTKNGVSTGEVNSNYGQVLDASGQWSQSASRGWNVSDIGSWTKTVVVLKNGQIAATSQPFAFTVKDCSSAVTSNVTLILNSANFCVYSKGEKTNDTAVYTVTGSSDLANQEVIWSSTKNGASTGEINSYYGQNLNSGSVWSGAASRTWNASDIGSWTKTAAIFQNNKIAATSQPFTFTVKDCSSTICQANTNFALNTSSPIKIGSTYSVQLTWSSTGSNQIKIAQVSPGSASETIITTGNGSGTFTVTGLASGSSYIFKMYDANCGGLLTTTSVTTPSNPGQLICSANVSSTNIGDSVTFTATGGTSGYTWSNGSTGVGLGSTLSLSFSSGGNKNVTVTSGDGQTANCGVVINTPVAASSGNCNNSTNSCNTTNTNTNNNCVNNSCNTTTTNSFVYTNTVYITAAGNTVPANQSAILSITKSVRSINNGGSFQNSVSVNNGDTVQFEIVVNNTGSASANNVRLTDNLPSGLSLVNGTVQVNGSTVSDNNLGSGMYLGTLTNGQSSRINFQARVNGNSGASIQNIANAISDNAGSVQASAWVFVNNGSVLGGNVNLTYSKRAVNETKNADATSVNASREDFITYTLTVSNSGNTPANSFVITDDLSQVLPYSDMVDNGGGNVNGNVISYPGITVPAGGSVSRSFKIRVKYALAANLSYVMTNTYGNTVIIRINNPQVLGAFVAPKTGADTNAFVFSGLLTGAAAVFKKRKIIFKLIFS